MPIENVVIMPHAIERFKQRYEALKGVKLADQELMLKLHALIEKAKPEKENPLIQFRRESHGGTGEYLISPPWRFVFSDKGLETCEVVPQEMIVIKNPHIPPPMEKARFFLKIKGNKRRLATQITRSYDKKTLHLQDFIETNSIVRSLRAIGLEVNRLKEPTHFEIVVPQTVIVYKIEQLLNLKEISISLGRIESVFPLGLQRVDCSGIAKRELEKILEFLQINNS